MFAELRRRNVFRAAAFYAASAWLLVQVATQVFPLFHVAEWVLRWIVIASVIGFPFLLVFSWFYEWTPQGLQLESEIAPNESVTRQTGKKLDRGIIAILSLAVVLLLTNQFVLRRDEKLAGLPSAAAIPSKSIAVLPFSDLSPNRDQESFSDGMAEEILNALAHIKDLKVVGRASSFFYKGKNVSLKQIGSELGVANVLEGSVRKQGEQVRITSALSRAADGLQVWSKNYNGTLANIFDLQESCARDIANELNVALADPSEARLVEKSTDNTQAYALFIEAQTLVSRRVGDSLPRAIALLKEATRLDPNFARAWAKLAVALAVEPQYAAADWQANWAAAEPAAQRAIALDAKSAEAYAALGYIAFSRRHYVEMTTPAARAVAADPEDFTANYWNANELTGMGRMSEAEPIIDRIVRRDPANRLAVYYKGLLRLFARDTAAAATMAQRADALGFALGDLTLASISAMKGDYERGAALFGRGFAALGTTFTTAQLETIYRGTQLDGANHTAALQVLATRPDDQYVPTLLLMLGEPERSFAEFERSSTGLSDAYLNFLWYPEAWGQKARQSPAFQTFAKRIGLVDYWKQNRWPDLCQPAPDKGPDAFTCQ